MCDRLVVATDAPEVVEVVGRAGYEAVLTSSAPQSGTERVAEVSRNNEFRSFDLMLNIQGDEPLVALDALQGALREVRGGAAIGTAAGPLPAAWAADPNRVKVVVGPGGRAAYFSRAPVPFDRDRTGAVVYYQHVGVYAMTRAALEQWVGLAPVPEEHWERLEQLRPLLHGMSIGVALLGTPVAPGVDTPEDLAVVEALLAQHLREVSP